MERFLKANLVKMANTLNKTSNINQNEKMHKVEITIIMIKRFLLNSKSRRFFTVFVNS